ncbi:hypothetical protein ABXS75_12550 [Roseburia hominis]
MLKRIQLFPLNFYKKEKFNGSIGKMNFRLEKAERTSGEDTETILKGTVWKGPYCYDATPDEVKETKEFAFAEEGICQALEWFEEQGKRYNTAK